MKNITIINAYADKNIGDAAILNVAVDLIKKTSKNSSISILSESGNVKKSLGSNLKNISSSQMPYGFAINSKYGKPTTIKKFYKFSTILFTSSLLVISNLILKRNLPEKGFYNYITKIKSSDLIVGIGGGYLITKRFTDYFGLLLTILPIYIAKIYRKKVIFLPISFGPFASPLQEKLCFNSLKNTTVMARDNISLKQLKSHNSNKINAYYAPDLALFLKPSTSISLKERDKYITLTAREWLPSNIKQFQYEKALANFIDHIWEKFKLKTIFVIMSNNTSEDDDNEIAKRILTHLKNKKSFQIKNPSSLNEAIQIFKNAKIAICTRMHSAIISSTVNTPFIAIGYGHKTLGLVQNMGLEKWHIDIKSVKFDSLVNLFEKLISEKFYKQFKQQLAGFQKHNKTYKVQISRELRLGLST